MWYKSNTQGRWINAEVKDVEEGAAVAEEDEDAEDHRTQKTKMEKDQKNSQICQIFQFCNILGVFKRVLVR